MFPWNQSYYKRNVFITKFLQPLNLVQEPPRVRTIFCINSFCSDKNIGRLAFPWVSIGSMLDMYTYNNHPEKIQHLYVFFHNKQWNNFDEAIDILRLPPKCVCHVTSNVGTICIGKQAHEKLINNKITPSEAFWMSEFGFSSSLFPRLMQNIRQPKRVLNFAWPEPYWHGRVIP